MNIHKEPVKIPIDLILKQSDSASIPILPNLEKARALEILIKFGKHPRFDLNKPGEFRFRPVGEYHATNDKKLMILEKPDNDNVWPVYKGESFDLWNCDTGKYYAYVDPVETNIELNRRRQTKNTKSAFSEMDSDWKNNSATIPCKNPRIAFRNITNKTNRRTMIAYPPPNVVLSNAAPYLLS